MLTHSQNKHLSNTFPPSLLPLVNFAPHYIDPVNGEAVPVQTSEIGAIGDKFLLIVAQVLLDPTVDPDTKSMIRTMVVNGGAWEGNDVVKITRNTGNDLMHISSLFSDDNTPKGLAEADKEFYQLGMFLSTRTSSENT